ncbi:hypothetical protein C2G38_2252229 [Gigaspora rosea]|uniref:Uncharacterized protein n=1 Tax=Gigaspora rosea TaxID=44941 RepID=A0A397UCV0_9GLOM|nr:hypothetical protein C2G38_2252229 [Gigaspora rosea]
MRWYSPNQEVSNIQVDDDIWNLPEDYPNYNSSEGVNERSASSVEHSFIEAELHQMDNMTQDDASQNTSNISDIKNHEDISFATESYEIGLEDYEGASFNEAFQDLYHPRTVEWPNDAYREFMEIINKYQLLNSAADAFITFFNKFLNLDISPLLPSTKTGKEFLDDTIVPYKMFKEVPVKTFQNIEYPLVLQYEDKKETPHMGKSFGHPMFLSLGNIPNHQRNKLESKALIGYLSILEAIDSKTKNSDKFRMAQRKVFQKCLSTLLEPIVEGPELHFVVRGDIITFIPHISIILADMVEADKFTNIYQPSCQDGHVQNAMKQAINSEEDKDYSIHPEKNAFWEIRNFNIYEAIVPDRMHALDLGLFKYMLDYTKELLYEQCGGQVFQTFEQRLISIPRYYSLKIIKNISDITRTTVDEL